MKWIVKNVRKRRKQRKGGRMTLLIAPYNAPTLNEGERMSSPMFSRFCEKKVRRCWNESTGVRPKSRERCTNWGEKTVRSLICIALVARRSWKSWVRVRYPNPMKRWNAVARTERGEEETITYAHNEWEPRELEVPNAYLRKKAKRRRKEGNACGGEWISTDCSEKRRRKKNAIQRSKMERTQRRGEDWFHILFTVDISKIFHARWRLQMPDIVDKEKISKDGEDWSLMPVAFV